MAAMMNRCVKASESVLFMKLHLLENRCFTEEVQSRGRDQLRHFVEGRLEINCSTRRNRDRSLPRLEVRFVDCDFVFSKGQSKRGRRATHKFSVNCYIR